MLALEVELIVPRAEKDLPVLFNMRIGGTQDSLINAQCRSVQIKIMALIWNASQCRIDRQGSELIDIKMNARILIGIGH